MSESGQQLCTVSGELGRGGSHPGPSTDGRPMSERRLHARDLFVSIDRSRRTTLSRQLEDQLRDAIRSGVLAAGGQLPSTRALAHDLSVSRGVIARAYGQLSDEGYLDLRQGACPKVRRGMRAQQSPPAQRGQQKALLNLRPHMSEWGSFPRRSWLRSVERALATAGDADLGYIDPAGLEQLRIELAAYLGRARGILVEPDQVVITAGTTHSLSLIARALSRRGSQALGFENPSHRPLHEVARHAGLEPVGIPVDAEGVVVERLGACSLDAVVVSPAHQFPTGCVLSARRRDALVCWAQETGALIIEHDWAAEFRYVKSSMGALHALAPDRVAYIGSTSKTLAPAVRLGWAVLPVDRAAAVADELAASLSHLSGIEQLAFADFLRRGEFEQHMRGMRTRYRARRDVLLESLAQRFPSLPVSAAEAGLHVVLHLESPEIEGAVRERARTRRVAVDSISQHALPGYVGQRGLLIGFGAVAEPTLPRAVEELRRALDETQFATSASLEPRETAPLPLVRGPDGKAASRNDVAA
jgi:GntR family transcriptional regulator/MocR family aminotransferase